MMFIARPIAKVVGADFDKPPLLSAFHYAFAKRAGGDLGE